MTSDPILERRLEGAYALDLPPGGIAFLDDRMSAAVGRALRAGAIAPRPRRSRRAVVLGLVAAAAITAGAGGALGLYDGMGAGFDYGFSLQLARSSPIDATAVDHGFRVTIDRAYLDGERLMLAVRVEDERKRSEVTQVMAMGAVVTDEMGTWEGAGGATSRPHGPWVATNIVWKLAPEPVPAGRHRFDVRFPRIEWRDAALVDPDGPEDASPWRVQRGDWAFEIEVPVDGGARVLDPKQAFDIDGTRFVLERVVIGRTAVRVRLTYDDPGATWSVFGSVRNGRQQFPFVLQSLGEDGAIELQTDGGPGDPAGEWVITIREAERQTGRGEEPRLVGPWEVEVGGS